MARVKIGDTVNVWDTGETAKIEDILVTRRPHSKSGKWHKSCAMEIARQGRCILVLESGSWVFGDGVNFVEGS